MDYINYNRREVLKKVGCLTAGGFLFNSFLSSCNDNINNKTILVVSGWQDVNIGDIAHTPGLLYIIKHFWPNAKVILWKKSKNEDVEKLIQANFPKVKIIHGRVDDDYEVHNEDVVEAFKESHMMIHGSGPYVVGKDYLEAWVKYSSKPFGIFGTTIQNIDDSLRNLLLKASFIYTRETSSLEVLKQSGLEGNHIKFVPDATFFLNIQNENKANEFLQEAGLEEGKFICVIPRLRYTPYHKIRKVDWSSEKIMEVEKINNKYKEQDHAKLREVMIQWVRQTGFSVLICPEMTYQVDIMDELLFDPLPSDVKPYVQKRGYWFPDEAASVYKKAFALLSFECHSPIIALRNETPAFYLRQPEDTIKGQMYYDLGLSDWVFEINDRTGEDIADSLMEIYKQKDRTKNIIQSLQDKTSSIYSQAVKEIKTFI